MTSPRCLRDLLIDTLDRGEDTDKGLVRDIDKQVDKTMNTTNEHNISSSEISVCLTGQTFGSYFDGFKHYSAKSCFVIFNPGRNKELSITVDIRYEPLENEIKYKLLLYEGKKGLYSNKPSSLIDISYKLFCDSDGIGLCSSDDEIQLTDTPMKNSYERKLSEYNSRDHIYFVILIEESRFSGIEKKKPIYHHDLKVPCELIHICDFKFKGDIVSIATKMDVM